MAMQANPTIFQNPKNWQQQEKNLYL